jgi:hypothetical protein
MLQRIYLLKNHSHGQLLSPTPATPELFNSFLVQPEKVEELALKSVRPAPLKLVKKYLIR